MFIVSYVVRLTTGYARGNRSGKRKRTLPR